MLDLILIWIKFRLKVLVKVREGNVRHAVLMINVMGLTNAELMINQLG